LRDICRSYPAVTGSGYRTIAENGETAMAREKLASVAANAATKAAGRNWVILGLQIIRVGIGAVRSSGRLEFQIDLLRKRA